MTNPEPTAGDHLTTTQFCDLIAKRFGSALPPPKRSVAQTTVSQQNTLTPQLLRTQQLAFVSSRSKPGIYLADPYSQQTFAVKPLIEPDLMDGPVIACL